MIYNCSSRNVIFGSLHSNRAHLQKGVAFMDMAASKRLFRELLPVFGSARFSKMSLKAPSSSHGMALTTYQRSLRVFSRKSSDETPKAQTRGQDLVLSDSCVKVRDVVGHVVYYMCICVKY